MKTTQLLTVLMLLVAFSFQSFGQEDKEERKNRRRNYGTHHNFEIDLGLNNYLEDGNAPSDNDALYAVKPWGSWYIALKGTNDTHVTGPFHLLWGPEVSWYNFKFENENVVISEGSDQVLFTEVQGDFIPMKSKLTAAYLNFSAVPMLKFGDSHRSRHRFHWHGFRNNEGFRIGMGGYAGYKIASYTKNVIKEDGDRNKDRNKDGFYLNNFRYGVRFQAGFRNLDIFVNYDLNELFAENKGPKLNAFSFGVVL